MSNKTKAANKPAKGDADLTKPDMAGAVVGDLKKPAHQQISLKQEKDEPTEVTFAKILLQPYINAVSTITAYQPLSKDADLTTMVSELRAQAGRVQSGDFSEPEAMLNAQARALDNIFNCLAQRAVKNITGGYLEAADTYMRMALKAQSQCRTTVEALAEIKYPKSATFIKQANIANQQQVNNGQPAVPAHEKTINPTNELLEHSHGERLDFGTTSTAGGINPDLASVGAFHRTEDRRR